MKGIILAGGTGSRLRPITHTGPKQLVPVANKPVLEYAIEDLVEAGIDEIGIVLGQTGRDAIQAYCGTGDAWNVEITYIVQGEPLGLAHAVGCVRDFVRDEPFVVYLGDDLLEEGIGPLVETFDPARYAGAVGLQPVDEPARYGIVERDETGDVIELVEKPADPPSNLALVGIYVFTAAIFDQIEELEKSWRGEYEITDAIQGLLDDGLQIQGHVIDGWWKDTGKPEDVLDANRLVLEDAEPNIAGTIEDDGSVTGRLILGAGSVIEAGATVRGPVSVGENTHIGADAYLGPYTSVGDDCVIEGVHLENSVIVGGAEIVGDPRTDERPITDSLIGRDATVEVGRAKQPAGNRFVIGRNAAVTL